jgi:hypothetical protein
MTGWLLVLSAFGAGGCGATSYMEPLEAAYNPALYRMPEADRWRGVVLGVARFEDRRSWIDHADPRSPAYVMQQGRSRYDLTVDGQQHIPVADLVQNILVAELGRAGVEAKPIPQVVTTDESAAIGEAGRQAGVGYLLGGRILVFEIVDEEVMTMRPVHLYRRAVTLELRLVRVADGERLLDTTVSRLARSREGWGPIIGDATINADRLLNSVFRQVVVEIVEKVIAVKLAMERGQIRVGEVSHDR